MEGGGHGDSYIKLSKFLLDCRRGGTEYDQSQSPVQQQYEAVGHAVRASYLFSGMADVAAETHNLDYQSAVISLWDNISSTKNITSPAALAAAKRPRASAEIIRCATKPTTNRAPVVA